MVRSFDACVSELEQKNRAVTALVSILIILFNLALLVSTAGVLLIIYAIGWVINLLTSEYHSRMLRAVGARVSPLQFPEVYTAAQQVRRVFNVTEDVPIVVVEASSVNALAVRFARKKMIVLYSEMLKSVQDSPGQLRFFLAHEMCHCALDFGGRRFLEIWKSAKFKRGREMTCDNAGVVAAGNISDAQAALAKCTVGRHLWKQLDRRTLNNETTEIMSGIIGYFVGQNLSHPTCGERLNNVEAFAGKHQIPKESAAEPTATAEAPVLAQ